MATGGADESVQDDSASADDEPFAWLATQPILVGRYLVERSRVAVRLDGSVPSGPQFLAKGGYSRLIGALDMQAMNEPVAIKIMAPGLAYAQVGIQEADLLQALNDADPMDAFRVVRLRGTFRVGAHCCLVLERLHSSLADRLRDRGPFPLREIRSVALQLLTFLQFMRQRRVVHADLKPENILYTAPDQWDGAQLGSGWQGGGGTIKVVDFGNAFLEQDASAYYEDFEIQSLAYRAPEVYCGLDVTPAIDTWSVGCILAELFTGRPLLSAASHLPGLAEAAAAVAAAAATAATPATNSATSSATGTGRGAEGSTGVDPGARFDPAAAYRSGANTPATGLLEAESEPAPRSLAHVQALALMHAIAHTLGPLPYQVLRRGRRAELFLDACGQLRSYAPGRTPPLPVHAAAAGDVRGQAERERRLRLALLAQTRDVGRGHGRADSARELAAFVSLLAALLDPNPQTRLTPAEAVLHSFFAPAFPFQLFFGGAAALALASSSIGPGGSTSGVGTDTVNSSGSDSSSSAHAGTAIGVEAASGSNVPVRSVAATASVEPRRVASPQTVAAAQAEAAFRPVSAVRPAAAATAAAATASAVTASAVTAGVSAAAASPLSGPTAFGPGHSRPVTPSVLSVPRTMPSRAASAAPSAGAAAAADAAPPAAAARHASVDALPVFSGSLSSGKRGGTAVVGAVSLPKAARLLDDDGDEDSARDVVLL